MSSGEKASSQKFTKAEKSWILYDWAQLCLRHQHHGRAVPHLLWQRVRRRRGG